MQFSQRKLPERLQNGTRVSPEGCSGSRGKEREREREKEKERKRRLLRQTDIHTERDTYIETLAVDSDSERQTDRQTD